jgi:hypothetical protein
MSVYWERQQGDLCRMHALNAFFGKPEITPDQFYKFCDEFDAYMYGRCGLVVSSRSYSMLNRYNIISWILRKYGVWLQYVPEVYGKNIELPTHTHGNFIFVYNFGHIWGIKLINGVAWSIDSLGSGPVQIDIASIRQMRNVGAMYTVQPVSEFKVQLNILRGVVPKTLTETVRCLTNLNRSKRILGDIEVPLDRVIDILEWHGLNTKKMYQPKYKAILYIVTRYNEFLKKFTGRYLDIDLILDYLPEIINYMIRFNI